MTGALVVDDVFPPSAWPSAAECADILRQAEASEYFEWAAAFTPYQGGRARLRLSAESVPDGPGLTALERELLDGLARIIAADMLRRREVAQC